jgi:putative ABC transport system permease protein
LQQAIDLLAIYPVDERFSRITLKVDIKKANQVVGLIESTWKKHFPSALFDYDFVSQQIKDQYQAEERFSKIFLYFSILSTLIACLGLYGLISYTVLQKTKEIGIRKILGATANNVALMLSKDFLKLVMLAFVIATPVAWYFMNAWLQDFAYRTNITWWMFAVAGSTVVLITSLTISFQSIKAAITNPVKSLRTE